MFNPVKLMKIFEVAWLIIAGISFIMGIYHSILSKGQDAAYPYLFVITVLALLMFYIKRKNRHFIEKRKSNENQNNA